MFMCLRTGYQYRTPIFDDAFELREIPATAILFGGFFSLPFSLVCIPVSFWAMSRRSLKRCLSVLMFPIALVCVLTATLIAMFDAEKVLVGPVAIVAWHVGCWRVRRAIPVTQGWDTPVCSECGYNLTGNSSGTCPECGTACDPSAR